MKKLILSLFLIVSPGVSACEIPFGEYRTMLEGHSIGKLNLVDKTKFEIEFGSSEAGEPFFSKFTKYTGIWSCDESGATFRYLEETVKAVYREHESYREYKGVKALVFPENSYIYKSLDDGVYWPTKL